LVKSRYVEAVQNVVSVMAAYCEACVSCTVWWYTVYRALCEGTRYTRLTGHNIQPWNWRPVQPLLIYF